MNMVPVIKSGMQACALAYHDPYSIPDFYGAHYKRRFLSVGRHLTRTVARREDENWP